jgi:probable phosphoglycerate mutase
MGAAQTTRLIAVRHGETSWNALGKQQGQLDTDLSELGIAQAEAVAEALAEQSIDLLYSSDLGRAMQTAEIIARRLALEILTDSRLRERHLGIIQGLTMAEFRERHPREYSLYRGGDPDYVIPEGESVRQRAERAVVCAEELAARHTGKQILLVTHGGIVESLLRHTLGIDLASPRSFSLFNGSLNSFSVSDGRWQLDSWGDIHHLRHLEATDDW